MMRTDELDIVIRLYDPTDLPRLQRCVFSLLGQGCAMLRVHILLQRFCFAEVQVVRAALQPVLDLDENLGVTLHNWEHAEPNDLRVPLLNFGTQVVRGRYLSCLEIGDVLLPSACTILLARLRDSEAVAAFGGMATQHVTWWGDVIQPNPAIVSPKAMPFEPFGDDDRLPPVFLLDRTRLPVRELAFQARRPDAEIVDFLYRLCVSHVVDVAVAAELLGLRQIPV